jgi:hypothetical protein
LSIHGLKEIGGGKTGLYLSGVDTVRVQTNRTYTIMNDTTVTLRLVISVSDVSYDNEEITVMFNAGSTALPYEPYGYQNGWEIRDNQNRLIWGREDEFQTTTGSLLFKGYSLPVKVKSLLGNGVQNGTPTPDAPIMPEFVGVRTANLYNINDKDVNNGYVNNAALSQDGTTSTWGSAEVSEYIQISGDTTYTFNGIGSYNSPCYALYDEDKQLIGAYRYNGASIIRFTSPNNARYFRFTHIKTSARAMMVEGSYTSSTMPEFEPYGYKIPITCAGQTVPVYLGEVPTVRRIGKFVLTGGENWKLWSMSSSSTTERFYINVSGVGSFTGICSHFQWCTDNSDMVHFRYGGTNNNELLFWIDKQDASTVADFKSYLAAKYANGTPVTVWYVPAEPEITIVNEPLCKIGDYADELTTIKVNGLSAPLYAIGDYKDILNLSTGVITRKIKKLVLTGEETMTYAAVITDTDAWQFPNNTSDYYRTNFVVSHMPVNTSSTSTESHGYIGQRLTLCFDKQLGLSTNSAIKTYLANQYAAGTPVTVWYVLSEPETETVSVPTGMTGEIEGYLTQISTPTPEHPSIPKWNGKEETGSTYAVTVYTPPEIPTTTGQNKLTVDTDLAPYNVTIDGHIKYTYWGKIREDVRSGLAQTKFPVGTILYDNEDETTGRAFQVVGYDKHFDPSLTARGYTHSMTLCQLNLSGPWQFDATEAFLYTTVEMQPGTYKFKIPNYDTAYGGNKTYYFTSTASVPVDSQIVLKWDYQKPPASVTAYAGPNPQTNTTAITGFNALQLSEWVEGESPEAIDLGTIKLSNNDPDSAYGKLNHIHRARYGSNNYYQSGLRQLLNTDLASNNWWHPTTIFDRPYGNRTTNGYLRSLNEDFVNVLATPEITHITNNIFEYPSLDGRTFTLNTEYRINTDKVFLLSHTEVGLSATPNIGTLLDYYSTHNTNDDRIKHRIDNGNAYHWWLRTPYPTYAHYFRYCSTSGALNYSIAYSSLGVAPAHIIQ